MEKKYIELYARFDDIEQMYNKGTSTTNSNYILTFFTDKGTIIRLLISDEGTKKTEKNPEGLSRLAQLGFSSEPKKYEIGNYLKLKLSIRKANKTEYITEQGTKKHKSDGIEIKAAKKVTKEIFEENYANFIANEYEDKIGEKLKDSWTYAACIEHFKRIHQNKS